MAFQNLYSKNITGMVDYAANTLGLNGACITFADIYTGCSTPGTSGISGTWITTNQASFANANWQNFVNNLPTSSTNGGTTFDYNQNSSNDIITLPPNTEVDYALLVWSGNSSSPAIDVTTRAITLTPPNSLPLSITPTFSSLSGSGDNFYTCSAVVTNIVATAGSGYYTVGNVYSEFSTNNASSGWVLYVVYKSPTLPFRNININVGSLDVTDGQPQTSVLTNFRTAQAGLPFTASLILSALNGNPASSGDQVALSNSSGVNTLLFGPYNPVDNFFGSQILDIEGTYCTEGTFGNLNATPDSIQNNPGRRTGFDITNVDITPALSNNQTSTTLTATSSGDGYYILSLASIIDNASPTITIVASSNEASVLLGDSYIVSYTITNSGSLATDSINFTIDDTGLNFVSGLYTKGGVNTPILSTPNGLVLPNLAVGENIVINLTYEANEVPDILHYTNMSQTQYTFSVGPDILENTLDQGVEVNIASLDFLSTTDLNPVSTTAPLVNPTNPDINYTVTNPSTFGTVTIVNGVITYTPNTLLTTNDRFVVRVTHDDTTNYVNLVYIVTNSSPIPCPDSIPYKFLYLLNNYIYLQGLTSAGITTDVCFDCNLWNNGYTFNGTLVIPSIKATLQSLLSEFRSELQGVLTNTNLNQECGSPAFKSQIERLLLVVNDLNNKILIIDCNANICENNLSGYLLTLLAETIDLLINVSSTLNGLLGICTNNCVCGGSFAYLMGIFINDITSLYNLLPSWNNLIMNFMSYNNYQGKSYIPAYMPKQPLPINNMISTNKFSCPPRNC